MDISSRLDFAADPRAVHLMMTDPAWLEELVAQTDATSHRVQVAGSTTRVEMSLPAPDEVSRFVGSSLDLVQDVSWGEPGADGSRDGTLHLTSPKLPVTLDGTARMRPGGRGTLVDYNGVLKVAIPLVGGMVERQAAPYVKDAIDAQQQAGDDWLASRHG